MVKLVVAVGGPIASGKTTLSHALAEQLAVSRRAFGDVVKNESVRRGRGTERLALQQTGDDLISEGWSEFVHRVLTPAPENDVLVVDGIRHLGAIDELMHQMPDARVVVVFVDPPGKEVSSRLASRRESPGVRFHHVESELPRVAARADLTVEGLDVEADVAAVLAFVGR